MNAQINKLFSDTIINLNGEITTPIEAKISVFDRGFLYGDSIYEVTRVYDGVPMFWQEHLDRLWHSAQRISLSIDLSREEITKRILETIKASNHSSAYVRLVITRGISAIGLDPFTDQENNTIIIVKNFPKPPATWYKDGVKLIISSVERVHNKSIDPNAKTGNYLNSVMAYADAKKQGAYDAVMVNRDGFITEATTSNIWIIKDGEVITPPLKSGILMGITRAKILGICEKYNIPHAQREFSAQELKNADECFLSASTKELVPVSHIDDIKIGTVPGDMTERLIKLYRECTLDYIRNNS